MVQLRSWGGVTYPKGAQPQGNPLLDAAILPKGRPPNQGWPLPQGCPLPEAPKIVK